MVKRNKKMFNIMSSETYKEHAEKVQKKRQATTRSKVITKKRVVQKPGGSGVLEFGVNPPNANIFPA
jgi:hypothetical protein